MNLDPALNTTDRIGSLAIGIGAVAFAILGDFDRTSVRAVVGVLGVVLAIGGIGGT